VRHEEEEDKEEVVEEVELEEVEEEAEAVVVAGWGVKVSEEQFTPINMVAAQKLPLCVRCVCAVCALCVR
jgi:hypothetical protein